MRIAKSPLEWQWSCWRCWACFVGHQEVPSFVGASHRFSVPQCCHHNLNIHRHLYSTKKHVRFFLVCFCKECESEINVLMKLTEQKSLRLEHKEDRVLTAPKCAIMNLYGWETVTLEVELSFHSKTCRVPLQNCPITAAGVCLLTGK